MASDGRKSWASNTVSDLSAARKNQSTDRNKGFDVTPVLFDKSKQLKVESRAQELHQSVAEWLFREVYS
jgi:hypothetical protein